MSNVILNVPDISCAHCEHTVLNALQGREGVKSVRVDIPTKTVSLDYDESAITLDQVGEILDEEGYPVSGLYDGPPPVQRKATIQLTSKDHS